VRGRDVWAPPNDLFKTRGRGTYDHTQPVLFRLNAHSPLALARRRSERKSLALQRLRWPPPPPPPTPPPPPCSLEADARINQTAIKLPGPLDDLRQFFFFSIEKCWVGGPAHVVFLFFFRLRPLPGVTSTPSPPLDDYSHSPPDFPGCISSHAKTTPTNPADIASTV